MKDSKAQKKEQMKQQKKHKRDPFFSKKVSKDPGVPNLSIIQGQIVAELKRKKPTQDRKRQLQGLLKNNPESFEEYIQKTTSKNLTYTEPESTSSGSYKDSSKKSYYKDMLKVIESSDIILEVVDARDPLGYKSQELENRVLSHGSKKLVVVLNKIDLVPGHIVQAWQKIISGQFPCVPFRSNTQEQQKNLSSASFYKSSINKPMGQEMLETNKTLGTDGLMNIIKNYMRSGDIKRAVTVGVVGYPNVGKSSVINSLRRAKAVGVSSTPGFTKCVQEVEIESNIKILDCPGIVFDNSFDPDMVLRNVVRIENVEDFYAPVNRIIEKVGKERMQSIYEVNDFGTTTEFLGNLARKRGKLKKGGIADLDAAGKFVLHDWVTGKIPYFVYPPDMMTE